MKTNQINKFFQNTILLFISVILFILANPNFLYSKGFGFLAWFYYIPLLFLINKCSYKSVWAAGGLFGALFYSGYAYWLYNYGPVCLIFIISFYAVLYCLLFLILKYASSKSLSYNWILLWLIISSFEYLKTKGFLGFNYGVTAYTQWKYTPLIQICDITGVFGLNAYMIFFSCLSFNFINKILLKKNYYKEQENNTEINQYDTHLHYLTENKKILKKLSVVPDLFFYTVFLLGFIFMIIYGMKKTNFGAIGTISVAAIQHNENPEDEGINSQINNFKTLYELTDSALEINEEAELVVWPETAIVPSIMYKYFKSQNESVFDEKEEKTNIFINNVLNYINRKNQVFVIGNNGTDLQQGTFVYTNDALVFESKKNVIPPEPEIYEKIKLVPFTEYIPFKKDLPHLYKKLSKLFGESYTPGKEYKIFNYNQLYFSTPICFEDTFPEVARNMYKAGARCFINVTNDSWSKSSSCQYQHMAMALFRSVENRVPSVRSATSGITCIISEQGKIIQSAGEFSKTFITGNINVIGKNRTETFYCKAGYLLEYGLLLFTGLLLLIQIITDIIKGIKGKKNGKKR